MIGALVALLMSSCRKHEPAPAPDFYHELKSVDKMVFASMAINKVAKLESSDWYTAGKRIAVYSYDSYMRAFIDLSELRPDDIVFDEAARTVKVTLPPVMTEITGRDMEMKKEYENIGLLRSDLTARERAEIKEKANASFKAEVADNPVFRRQLIEAATRKARQYFETLLEADGYTAVIEFRS